MSRRLLVGVAEAGELNPPRRYLLDLLEGLAAIGVEIQVALLEDGPVRRDLEAVADVRVLRPLPPRSAAGLAQSLARRIGPDMADRVHDARTIADRRWIKTPDAIHLNGPKAAPLLRYVRTHDVPVTTYAHPWDFSIAGLSPLDLQRLIARTDRYVAAEDSVAADLVAAGVDPARIEPAPALQFPLVGMPADERAVRRAELRLPAGTVVAVEPVPDWVDFPDQTLAVAWELARLADRSAPSIWWYGMPSDGEARWAIDYDIDRMGLRNVQLAEEAPAWEDLVALADVVVLSPRSPEDLPADFAVTAAQSARPVLGWAGDLRADEVRRWGGTVVATGDIAEMATALHTLTAGPDGLRQGRQALWSRWLAGVELVAPLCIPVPECVA